LRIGGKTQWLHIAATVLLTFYRIASKRGAMPENRCTTVRGAKVVATVRL
jgi:hypothetical protein